MTLDPIYPMAGANQFSNEFDATIAPFHLLKHPFYRAWMEGKISKETLQDYALQYRFHVDYFPRYISSLHSVCDQSEYRKQILQNLNDEEGTSFGTSHPELWQQFARGLGVTEEQLRVTTPRIGIENVIAEFREASRSSFHEGLGALYAYESQVPEVATSKIEGLKSQYGIHDSKTLEFFSVHQSADIEHRSVVLNMLEQLPPEKRQAAIVSAKKAAQSLWNFLTEIFERETLLHPRSPSASHASA